jgi:hypothetical protein
MAFASDSSVNEAERRLNVQIRSGSAPGCHDDIVAGFPAWGNAIMDMILYRRFFIVVFVIAALGAITANVIIETRSGAYGRSQASGWANPERCISGRLCLHGRSILLAG